MTTVIQYIVSASAFLAIFAVAYAAAQFWFTGLYNFLIDDAKGIRTKTLAQYCEEHNTLVSFVWRRPGSVIIGAIVSALSVRMGVSVGAAVGLGCCVFIVVGVATPYALGLFARLTGRTKQQS